jgi:hypothetical protein
MFTIMNLKCGTNGVYLIHLIEFICYNKSNSTNGGYYDLFYSGR